MGRFVIPNEAGIIYRYKNDLTSALPDSESGLSAHSIG